MDTRERGKRDADKGVNEDMKSIALEWILPFFLGSIFGSFLNVCIYRLPIKRSILSPGSFCPECSASIRWYDNIPVLSYLLLKGRCRDCFHPIPFRYPGIELIAGVIIVAMIYFNGFTVLSVKYIVLAYLLVVIAVIDWDHLFIPNSLVLFGLGAGVIFLLIGRHNMGWIEALSGAILMGGFLYATGGLGKLIFQKESMGMGDVKLGAMIGLFIGWKWVAVALFLTFISAGIFGIVGLISGQIKFGQKVPFGPFLSLGTVFTLLIGDWIILSYLTLIGL